MAPVNKSKVFFCRDESCTKKFTDMSNRNRHEKRFNHKPAAVVKKRTKQPLYNHIEKKYTCALPGCSVKSNFKGNITRHMKDCAEQMLRKKKKDGNKVCEFCGKTFGQNTTETVMLRLSMKTKLLVTLLMNLTMMLLFLHLFPKLISN